MIILFLRFSYFQQVLYIVQKFQFVSPLFSREGIVAGYDVFVYQRDFLLARNDTFQHDTGVFS